MIRGARQLTNGTPSCGSAHCPCWPWQVPARRLGARDEPSPLRWLSLMLRGPILRPTGISARECRVPACARNKTSPTSFSANRRGPAMCDGPRSGARASAHLPPSRATLFAHGGAVRPMRAGGAPIEIGHEHTRRLRGAKRLSQSKAQPAAPVQPLSYRQFAPAPLELVEPASVVGDEEAVCSCTSTATTPSRR